MTNRTRKLKDGKTAGQHRNRSRTTVVEMESVDASGRPRLSIKCIEITATTQNSEDVARVFAAVREAFKNTSGSGE